jgi:hypothetical protein
VADPEQAVQCAAALVAVGLLCLFNAAVGADRSQPGLFRRLAAALEVVGKQFQVGPNLACKLPFKAIVAEAIPESRKNSSQAQHRYCSSASSFSTTPAICRQRAVSSSSAFNPAFVMV